MIAVKDSWSMMPTVERWGLHELNFAGPPDGGGANAFAIRLNATFRHSTGRTLAVSGFFDGGNVYRLRFSPPLEGRWTYATSSSAMPLDGHSGILMALPPRAGNHGPVESRGYGLFHADGMPHLSVGTTSYAWASQPFDVQERTLKTLGAGPFNKVRMTILPKWYVYNHANPVQTGAAFPIMAGTVAANASAWGCVGSHCPSTAGSFDTTRFNVSFWRRFDSLIGGLQRLGIVADVILFHPYDDGHWGFDCLGGTDPSTYDTRPDAVYLRYAVARLAAYSNVWWSMANEWSFVRCKSRGVDSTHLQSPAPVWDELFAALSAADPYQRQASIHNGNLLYNHSRPWISHVSLQGLEDRTADLRRRYAKPLIWDEVEHTLPSHPPFTPSLHTLPSHATLTSPSLQTPPSTGRV